jgi:hypothetical protein
MDKEGVNGVGFDTWPDLDAIIFSHSFDCR